VKRQRTDNARSAIDPLLKRYSTRNKKFAGNIDHLKIFDSALDAARHRRTWRPWLRWREQHPRLKLDLRGIHLAGCQLMGIDLRGVRLDGGTLVSRSTVISNNQNLYIGDAGSGNRVISRTQASPSRSASVSWVSGSSFLPRRSRQSSRHLAHRCSTECNALQTTDCISVRQKASL